MNDRLATIFLRVRPADIAHLKFLFESYEGVAVIRTLDRSRAIIVALVSRDFLHVARAILDEVRDELDFEEIEPPRDAGEDWLLGNLWNEGNG